MFFWLNFLKCGGGGEYFSPEKAESLCHMTHARCEVFPNIGWLIPGEGLINIWVPYPAIICSEIGD